MGRLPPWYLVLLAAEGLQRLRELRISAAREAAVTGRQAARARYPLMVALHVALFALPPLEIAACRRQPRGAPGWAAVLAAATGLRWWSISSLGPWWNVRAVVPDGLDPVTAGPYRHIRHPNYVAVALEFLALPMAGGAWLSALGLSALNAVLLWDRVRAEERLLAAVPGYEAAFKGRARFIPGLF